MSVLVKYLSSLWRTLKMLINYEVNLMLNWSADLVIGEADRGNRFCNN